MITISQTALTLALIGTGISSMMVGIVVAVLSYQHAIDKVKAERRAKQEALDRIAYRLSDLDRKGQLAPLLDPRIPAPSHGDQLLALILRELGTDRLKRPPEQAVGAVAVEAVGHATVSAGPR